MRAWLQKLQKAARDLVHCTQLNDLPLFLHLKTDEFDAEDTFVLAMSKDVVVSREY
jgi:hypothetical protein